MSPLSFFLFFLVCVHGVCVPGNCPPTFSPFTLNTTYAKTGIATSIVRIGMLVTEGPNTNDRISIARMGLGSLNNNLTFLPNVLFELYVHSVSTQKEVVVSSLQLATMGNNGGIIAALTDAFTTVSQDIISVYDIPEISLLSTSDLFTSKYYYPTLFRATPTYYSQMKGMARLIQHYNYMGCLVITENSGYGINAFTVFQAASQEGLPPASFWPFNVLFPPSPTPMDLAMFVGNVQFSIDFYQLKVIVLLLDSPNGWKAVEALSNAGIYGSHLMYILSQSMATAYLDGSAPANYPVMNGALGYMVFSTTPLSVQLLEVWNSSDPTVYPGFRPYPHSDWYSYDSLYAFAHAIDALQTSGGDYTNTTQYMKALEQVSFEGVNGKLRFDMNRDHNEATFLISSLDAGPSGGRAYYSSVYDNITYVTPLTFFNGSTTPPRICVCYNGTCEETTGVCTCFEGFSGDFCQMYIGLPQTITHEKGLEAKDIIVWAIPVAVVLVVLILAGILYVRRRRNQIAKEMALKQRSEIPRDQIKLGDRIGRGASGEVFKGYFRGTEIAVKRLLTGGASKNALDEFLLETAIMCGLRHPNIVMFMGSCFVPEEKEMLLVMEFMARGSLHDVLHSKLPMSIELQLHLACQASQGMNFLHESNPPIIHSDLKSHNILFDDKWTARISDFGITKFKDAKSTSKSESGSNMGTIFWTAPEVLSGQTNTEASDCYSFGVVLWEIFHRSDPYPGKDLVAVAVDVLQNGARPMMNPNTPREVQDLIRECWAQDPAARPTFQTIMTRLRHMSSQHPMYNFSAVDTRVEAPTGLVYLVYGTIPNIYEIFDAAPRATRDAIAMYQTVQQNNLESYGGYEVRHDEKSFLAVFPDVGSALNFCTATQVSLVRLSWPKELLALPQCNERQVDGVVAWRGLRVRMSIVSGTPTSEVDHSTGRMSYSGPIVDRAVAILTQIPKGSIVASALVEGEISGKSKQLIEQVESKPCDFDGENSEYFRVIPVSLKGRDSEESDDVTVLHPNSIGQGSNLTRSSGTPRAKWVIPFRDLVIKGTIGRGAVGDYSHAILNGKEVVVKMLVNQKLNEKDYLQFLSDAALLHKIDHPNLLPFRGVCVDPGHISIVMDYVAKGNLRKVLSEELIPMPLSRCMKVAMDIATGIQYLTMQQDPELHIFDNFKSHNIMITKDWDVKVTDFGQRSVKDLARTMTAISSVAWTAPEILNGEPCTEQCTPYSFGIILWELLTRKIPYENEHPIKVVAKILSGLRPPIPADCPTELNQLICHCWHEDPAMRPTWSVILTELAHVQSRYGSM